MAEDMVAGDTDTVRRLALPIVINDRQEAVEILDASGTSLVSLRHQPDGQVEAYDFSRGDAVFRDSPFVQEVLQGHSDASGRKCAGAIQGGSGSYFYVAGPR